MFVLHLFANFNSHITMHSFNSYSVTAYKNMQLFNNYICAMATFVPVCSAVQLCIVKCHDA